MEETLAISWHHFACKQEVMYPVSDVIIRFCLYHLMSFPMTPSLT